MTLQATETECAANAVAPRVSLKDIEASIVERFDWNAGHLVRATGATRPVSANSHDPMDMLSICVLVMRNGFTVIGKSAPASPENFKAELGRKLAYEDAVRQLWPLMGFALRDKLSAA